MNDNDHGSGDLATYPHFPGSKGTETSALAASSVAEKAPRWRAICLGAIEQAPGGLTANELADALECHICTVRPRVTELARMGKIHDSGARRRTPSGCTAIVWRAGPAVDVAQAA